jgi:FkbM family methyltransferase
MGLARRIANRARRIGAAFDRFDFFLAEVSTVVHVGASEGQERYDYDRPWLRVFWVEPIPEVFARLSSNLRPFPRQHAIQQLVTDRDDVEYPFHIASNGGMSSSILELGLHRELWPDVAYERTIVLKSATLASLVARGTLTLAEPAALVLDTQGSELLVLRGAGAALDAVRFIKLEAWDFEAYQGCARLDEIDAFLADRGFRQLRRRVIGARTGLGSAFDVVYVRADGASAGGNRTRIRRARRVASLVASRFTASLRLGGAS